LGCLWNKVGKTLSLPLVERIKLSLTKKLRFAPIFQHKKNDLKRGQLPLNRIFGIKMADGQIDEIIPKHQVVYYKTIKAIQHDNKPMPSDLNWTPGNQPNEWIYGPTRTGKSWKARRENPGHFAKMPNKWWDRYAGQKCVIIEDLGRSHEYLGDHLKIWADVYAFPVEIKNAGDLIRPNKIVVTSNYSIIELFPDPNVHKPLLERFKEIHLTLPWDANLNSTLGKKPGSLPPRKPTKQRKRKYDMPLTRPPMYRQNAKGDLVPWTDTQPKFGPSVKQPRFIQIPI
jgi:hypothetical protein